jgi:hypothetical protein
MTKARIKILKDTPFNLAGDILELKEFRLKYNYICLNQVSDEDLIRYIKDYASYPQIKQMSKYNVSEWFQVVEEVDLEPLAFVHEDLWYIKMMDGWYHVFVSPMFYAEQIKNGGTANEIKRVCVAEVRKLITKAKFRKNIMYCTNNVNKKL